MIKKMKNLMNYMMVTLLGGVMFLASCGDDPVKTGTPVIEIENASALEQTLFADVTVGDTLRLNTAGAWASEITGTGGDAPEWISITPASGNAAGHYDVAINLEENETGEDRAAKITISSGDGRVEVNITQKGTTADGKSNEKHYDIYAGGGNATGTGYLKNGELEYCLVSGYHDARLEDLAVAGDDVHFVAQAERAEIITEYVYENGKIIAKTYTYVYRGSYHVKNDDLTWIMVDDIAGKPVAVHATGIDVKGADVYVAGYALRDGGPVATCWMNGGAAALGGEASRSVALDVAVTGNGDVHVLGYDGVTGEWPDIDGFERAGYWKNGQFNDLPRPDGLPFVELNDIHASGEDVHVAGTARASATAAGRAVYWKNGEPRLLDTRASVATGLAVSGSDVYVTGRYEDSGAKYHAVYWKNGEMTDLGCDGTASAVSIAGNNAYVMVTGGGAGLYKNGKKMDAGGQPGTARRLFVVPASPSREW
jgi:hypothetical protein